MTDDFLPRPMSRRFPELEFLLGADFLNETAQIRNRSLELEVRAEFLLKGVVNIDVNQATKELKDLSTSVKVRA